MVKSIFLSLGLLVASTPLWCQVEPSASGGSAASGDDSMVELPPQMSGSFYPSGVADESRQNLLSAGLLFTVAYDDNLLTGLEAHPVSAKSYIIEPNIALSTKTSRLSGSLSSSAAWTP